MQMRNPLVSCWLAAVGSFAAALARAQSALEWINAIYASIAGVHAALYVAESGRVPRSKTECFDSTSI